MGAIPEGDNESEVDYALQQRGITKNLAMTQKAFVLFDSMKGICAELNHLKIK